MVAAGGISVCGQLQAKKHDALQWPVMEMSNKHLCHYNEVLDMVSYHMDSKQLPCDCCLVFDMGLRVKQGNDTYSCGI